ncbi:MAG TPA: ATP-binding protein, partial [Steroidobacteraceae bacterium]|nr:ATP-binding protein [Steroidobacteraceae bacterium]
WIGTHGGGANILDPGTGLVRQVPYDSATPGATSAAGVTAFAEDRSGYFWIGTDGGGLDLARPDGTVIGVFRHDPNDSSTLPANTVFALAVDGEGRLWVATDGGGLAQVEGSVASPQSIRFQVATGDQRLASDTVYGVLSDARGRLWLSGNAGLMRYDPETHITKTYHREHGLQGEEFNFGAYYRLRDGRLCFGGPGGFNIFDPARLPEDHPPPRLALTGLEVLGVPAPAATPYWLRHRIDVDSRASVISLDFGALDFTSPKRNRLAYRMAGLTDQWIDLGTQHRVTLTNLDAGDHVLEVRAANADSVWSDTPLRLTIHRDPAPWKSPWAFVAYALAALGVGAYALRLQRLRFRRIVEAQRRLESEVALRTGELLESNQRLAEAAQAKSNFLDRMSHELRTPMNGVVGMTELLARTALSPTQARLTRTIRSSAQILLQIVNDLLDLSKIQAGKVGLEELPIDLVPLLEECTSVFMGAAEAKGIELIVCPPASDGGALLGDPLRIRQILMNLIGNAVKFTAHGEIVVKADVQCDAAAGTVHFSVSDTGIGMDAATIARIFEPFTQADESTSRRYGGSGLGLAICRELTVLLGGTITVESRPSSGSIFRVTLPLRVAVSSTASTQPRLPSRPVRILTRRHALAESLARCVSALGLEVLTDTSAARPGSSDELVIADVGGYEEYLRAFEAGGRSPRTTAVVVASAAEVETQRLRQREDAMILVLKPVYRGALYEALSSAIGDPLRDAAAAAPLLPAAEALGAHVLLVEDEPVNAAVAQGYLAALGCTSVWVENGPEAIARSAVDRFDLILMDLSMPGMDGFATTALIRARERTGSQVPIIALTAHDALGYREACI